LNKAQFTEKIIPLISTTGNKYYICLTIPLLIMNFKTKILAQTLFASCFIFSYAFSQDIVVEKQKFPFSDILEWPEHGLILFAKDPAKNTLQQELSYVNQKGELVWQEHYIPMVENPFVIASHESDYLYFLDQLQPDESGKIYFNQASLSGYIKKGSIFFPPLFRSLGDENMLNYQLIDIINSHDNLIFHFRQEDKKDKLFKDVLIFYSHVLLKAYPLKVPGSYLFSELENGTKSLLQYAGSKEGANYFCTAATVNKTKGYEVLNFDDKAKPLDATFLSAPSEKVNPIEIRSNQLNGAYYLKSKVNPVLGQLQLYKNAFYLMGGNESGALSVWKYESEKPEKLISSIAVEHKKSTVYQVGASFLNNRLILFTESDLSAKTRVFDMKGQVQGTGFNGTADYERNPSLLLFGKNSSNFVIQLGNVTYQFNKQLFAPSTDKAVFQKQ